MPGAKSFWKVPGAKSGVTGLGILVLLALLGPWLLPDPLAMPELGAPPVGPGSLAHPLGTDHLSRDLLARIAAGARISLTIGLLAASLSIAVGTAVGVIAGLSSDAVDAMLMRLVDAALALPRLFLLLILLIVWDRIPVPALVIAIGLTGWFGTSRLVRGEVKRLKGLGYVDAARALGADDSRIAVRHLLPHLVGVIAVSATLGVGDVILLEAGLSFLGLGIQPPTPSWGAMVLDYRTHLASAPWTVIFPGLAIAATVLCTNLVGEAVRAAFDPRQA